MVRYLVACDVGGTMTDVIVVDEHGPSVIGKAPIDECEIYWLARGGSA
jgi:N-methylhydantoinase A/oxoprolinase/acetone carboxylase beta subunit